MGGSDMALLLLNDISLTFGTPHPLLDGASLQIEPGERIGLLGRNGSGKSTLMKLVAGQIVPDAGDDSPKQRCADRPAAPGRARRSARNGLRRGCFRRREDVELLREYHDITERISHGGAPDLMDKLERVQHQIETSGAWHYHQRIESVITRMELDENAEFRFLSAGLKRRVFLAGPS